MHTKRWIKPLSKDQAEPDCGCVTSITGTELYICPTHAKADTISHKPLTDGQSPEFQTVNEMGRE